MTPSFPSASNRENELAVWDPKNPLVRPCPSATILVCRVAAGQIREQPIPDGANWAHCTCTALASFALEGAGSERSYEGRPISRETVIWARPESYNFENSVVEHKNEHEDRYLGDRWRLVLLTRL
jgi:hypothetical protein